MFLSLGVAVIVVFLTLKWTLSRLRIKQKNNDLYVLITGCDTGFGLLAAKSFAERGINVFAAYLREFGADTELNQRLIPIQLDVTKEDDIKMPSRRSPTSCPQILVSNLYNYLACIFKSFDQTCF